MQQGYVVQGGIRMTRGGSVRIDDGAGVLVHVEQGEVWITQEGDHRDHIIGAASGRWFRLERDGVVFLDAMGDARLTLSAPTPDNYARLVTVKPAPSAAPRVIYDARERGNWLAGLRYRFRFLEKRRFNAGTL